MKQARGRRRHPESDLQISIVEWLQLVLAPGTIVHGSLNEEPSALRRMLNAAMGARAGFSDLLIVGRGQLLFMELKTAKGRQEPSQVEFQRDVEALGWPYVIVRSVDEAITAVMAAGFPHRIVSAPGTPVARIRLRSAVA